MAKSAPISCETVQNPRGRDRRQGRSNRQRRCERKPQHREKRTSVPCSPVLETENELAAPPPGAAARDRHPARLTQPAEKRPGFLLAEAGRPFAQAEPRHLVERVPFFDGHIGGQAAL